MTVIIKVDIVGLKLGGGKKIANVSSSSVVLVAHIIRLHAAEALLAGRSPEDRDEDEEVRLFGSPAPVSCLMDGIEVIAPPWNT